MFVDEKYKRMNNKVVNIIKYSEDNNKDIGKEFDMIYSDNEEEEKNNYEDDLK